MFLKSKRPENFVNNFFLIFGLFVFCFDECHIRPMKEVECGLSKPIKTEIRHETQFLGQTVVEFQREKTGEDQNKRSSRFRT